MKDSTVIHPGTVKHGHFIPYKKGWWESELMRLEGKEVTLILEEVIPGKTLPQLALYFGVIIRKYCMTNEMFGGWLERDIDMHLRLHLRSYQRTFHFRGNQVPETMVDDIAGYNKTQMNQYIEEVIEYLATLGIIVDDTVNFKLRKYLKE